MMKLTPLGMKTVEKDSSQRCITAQGTTVLSAQSFEKYQSGNLVHVLIKRYFSLCTSFIQAFGLYTGMCCRPESIQNSFSNVLDKNWEKNMDPASWG